MSSKKFVTLLSITTISALLGPFIISKTGISWQSYCMLQGSLLSLIGSYID